MMRFRCPHCQQILEVEGLADTLLCPACEMWCRIPSSSAAAAAASQRSSPPPSPRWREEGRGDDFEIRREPPRPVIEPTFTPPQPPLEVQPVIAPPAPVIPPQETIAEPPPVEPPALVPAESEEVEDIEFEVIKKGGQRRRKRRRRRLLRSLSRGFDYWVGPTLILLVIFGPAGLFLAILMFWLHPMAGVGALMVVGGGLWLMLLAAEDGFLQALLVLFVPFYVLYYVFANYERALIPFIIQCIGGVILMVTLLLTGLHAVEKQISMRTTQGSLTHTAA